MASSVPLTSKLFLLPPFPPFSTSAVASAAHSSPPSVSSARVLHVQNGNPHHTGIAHLCSSRTGRVQSCNCDGDGDGHCNGDNDDDGHMLDTSDSCAAPASSNSLQLHRGYTAPCWPHILSDFSTHLKKRVTLSRMKKGQRHLPLHSFWLHFMVGVALVHKPFWDQPVELRGLS